MILGEGEVERENFETRGRQIEAPADMAVVNWRCGKGGRIIEQGVEGITALGQSTSRKRNAVLSVRSFDAFDFGKAQTACSPLDVALHGNIGKRRIGCDQHRVRCQAD